VSAPRVDPSTWSPRDRARQAAARALVHLGWYLLALAAFELVAAIVDAAAEPADPPAWLGSVGLAARALLPLGLVFLARGLTPWARALGLGVWIIGASFLAVLSAVIALARLAEVAPPEGFPPDVWEPATRLVAGSLHLGALVIVLLVAARAARREELNATARAITWSSLSFAGALLACLVVLEPALLPSWWLGSAAPLIALVVLALARVVPWDRALWPVLFAGLAGALLLVLQVSPVALAAAAAALGVVVAAVMPRGPLFDLSTVLAEEPAAAPSRTFIRRLLDGPTDSQIGDMAVLGSRVGSQVGAEADGLDEAASLALAYRELGIDPPGAARAVTAGAPAQPASDLPPLGPIARLEPKPTGRHGRPLPTPAAPSAQAPVAVAPASEPPLAPADLAPWDDVRAALQLIARGFIARTCALVFGVVLMRAPIAHAPWARAVALGVFAVAALAMAVGAFGLARRAPLVGLRARARIAALLLCVTALLDAALAVVLAISPRDALPLAIADAGAFVIGLAMLLALLRLLFADLGQPEARGRITVLGFELLIFTALAAIAAVSSQNVDSDMAWLAYPTGIGAALAGLAFFGSFLWLVTDARTLVADWQVRIRRASAPDAREEGDPDPLAPDA